MRSIKKSASFIALVTVILLSACSPKAAEPTVDANAVYTQAAATVQSQLTETALAMPTATATVEPTQTQAPTETQAPTATVVVVTLTPGDQASPADQTAQPVQQVQAVATNTPAIGALPTAGTSGQKAGDNATFAYNVPADGKSFAKGEEFMLALGLANTGSTTWTEGYQMVFLGGTAICRENSVPLGKKVKPGEKGEFDFGCVAPGEAGSYVSRWKMTNSSGLYVTGSEIYFKYTVQ